MRLKQFFDALIPLRHLMELRAIRIGYGVKTRMFAKTPEDVAEFSMRHGRDAEIYMGVAPRIENGSGGLSNCALPTALWVDADDERAARAELALFDLEPSMVVQSGRGLHLYWLLKKPPRDFDQVRAGLRQLASRLEGDMKSAEPAHILRIPGTMNHKYSPPRAVKFEKINTDLRYDIEDILSATALVPVSRSAAFIKGMAYMTELPPAIQGEAGDNATYVASCYLMRDLGLDEDEAMELMSEWNTRCVPPWTEAELRKKIRSGATYGKNQKGIADPAVDFEELAGKNGSATKIVATDSWMKKLTDKFYVVNDNDGKVRIYEKVRDAGLARDFWKYYTPKDFLEMCKYVMHLPMKNIGTDDNPVWAPYGKAWLETSGNQTFNGMTMRPECQEKRTPQGELNMWTGFSCEPRRGSWAVLKSLIFESLCRWDGASYDYILNWMALAVQQPWLPASTALVFRGKKGTGKGTLGRAFYKLFGQHGMHFASRELLTGRFNAHLRDCVALFADEAFYAGDKSGESVLKAFITEPALVYEGKGKDPTMGRNCLHVIMASNMDWVVPAGMDNERRFAVFEVEDDDHDRQWWNSLYEELANGGMEGMLFELMYRDVSQFDVRRVPQNSALAAQRAHGMDHIAAWLLDAAENEWQDFTEQGEKNLFLAEDINHTFMHYCDERNIRNPRQNKTSFGISIRKYMPEGFPRRLRIMREGRQKYFYVLPDAEKSAEYIRNLLGIDEDRQENR